MILPKTVKAPFQRGSALIAVIAAIAIFSVLAAALLSMTSTSARQTAQAHLTDQAYFMAESGYRYITSQYRHPPAATPNPNDVLENLDGTSTTLDGSDGRFELKVSSYFYEITADEPAGEQHLSVRVPGNFPDDEIDMVSLPGQMVFIKGSAYTISNLSADHLTLDINGPGLNESVEANNLVYPLTNAGNSSPWHSENRTITLSDHAKMFPARKGRIRVAGRTLTYGLKVEGATNDQLIDVTDPNGTPMSGFNIPNSAAILLLPYIRVDATGIMGGGDAVTQRKVSYYGALPADFSEVYTETFNGESSILTASSGADVIDTVGEVLKVTNTSIEKLYLSQLDIDNDETAKAALEAFNSFRGSSGGYLSYDAQTKVGFFDTSGYHANYIEHSDLAAGLSFRINSEAAGDNMYGLSFLHEKSLTSIPAGIIPNGLPPNEPIIVLWQQTIDETDPTDPVKRTWLAYKKLKTLFYDDFNEPEINSDIWSIEAGNWVLSDQALFITGLVSYQGRISLSIDLPDCECADYHLRFHSAATDSAARQFKVFSGGVQVASQSVSTSPHDSDIDFVLPIPIQGTEITIQFLIENFIDTGSWEIDNVHIVDESPFPIHNATLLVRLREAAAIPFNYQAGATTTIETGDIVIGEDSNTWGRVIAPPIIAATESPQGWVLINSLSETSWFTDETLNIPGKGSIAAVYGTPDEATLRKSNIIKVYHASADGCGESSDSPLDCYTKPYPQRVANQSLVWPVQENAAWTAEKDYFRLIQWDAVNDGNGTDPDGKKWLIDTLPDTYGGNEVDRTVILGHHAKLQTPNIGVSFSAPELGLHAMGTDAVNEFGGHVYFDDFGFRLFYLRDIVFPPALQQ